jgi:putative alpha-1,2-mannosidase
VPFDAGTQVGFAQGTVATFAWMVPHDVRGLAAILGGMDAAAARLDRFFHGPDGAWVFGRDPLRYDAANEPAIHAPWLYVALGRPWKTQETVRAIARLAYGLGPKGLPGNDDLGTMSAWYVFAALGLYPQTPDRAEMLLSSPFFESAVLRGDGRPPIRIVAPDASPSNGYIDRVWVDGRAWDRAWLPETFVNGGGEVRIALRATPNERWAAREESPPRDR